MLRPPLYRNKKLVAGITQGSRQAALDVNLFIGPKALPGPLFIHSFHLGLVRFSMLGLLPGQVLTVVHSKGSNGGGAERKERSKICDVNLFSFVPPAVLFPMDWAERCSTSFPPVLPERQGRAGCRTHSFENPHCYSSIR
eukprot:Gb_29046 [translate_table: standard]